MKRTLWVLVSRGELVKVGFYEDLKKYGDDLDIKEMECNACFEYELITLEEWNEGLIRGIRANLMRLQELNDQLIKELKQIYGNE